MLSSKRYAGVGGCGPEPRPCRRLPRGPRTDHEGWGRGGGHGNRGRRARGASGMDTHWRAACCVWGTMERGEAEVLRSLARAARPVAGHPQTAREGTVLGKSAP